MSTNRDVWANWKRPSRAGRLWGVGALLLGLLMPAGCTPSSPPVEETDDTSSVPLLPDNSLLSELNRVEMSLMWRVNEARRKAGVLPLTLKPDLCRIAQKYNVQMVQLGRITRFYQGNKDVGDLLKEEGVNWNLCAINLARVPSFAPNIPQKAVDVWLADPTAKKDMEFNLYNETGIAAMQDPRTGQWFLTQIYARRASYWLP